MISPSEIAALFREHAPGLTLLARARFLESAADDVVQDAFIRLAQQSRLPVDPLAWLARTVRNLAIDEIRKQGRRATREQTSASSRGTWFIDSAEMLTDDLSGDEATDALATLSEADREIVVAHLWGNMSFRQIAVAFNLSSSSSAHRQYDQAINQLRKALGVKHV